MLASYGEAFNNLGYRIFYSAAPESGVLSPQEAGKALHHAHGIQTSPQEILEAGERSGS